MIAFLLGLLKIIGITLLVVLILLLVIVGIVLFVPIRYGGNGQITEDKKEASAKVTWLLRAVQCRVDYNFPEKPVICVKVLGIDILKLLQKQKDQKTSDTEVTGKHSAPKEKKPAKAKKNAPGINMSLLEPESIEEAPKTQTVTAQKDESKKAPVPKATTEEAPKEKEAKEKVPLQEKLQTIIDKVKNIIYNINYYMDVLQEEESKQLISDAWEAIMKILKSICPRVFQVNGEFGFATPDTTGKVYGMYAMVLPMLGEHVVLEPNFDEQVIRGKIVLKGRITIFVIVVNALRIVFDKRLQPLIRKLKHGGK